MSTETSPAVRTTRTGDVFVNGELVGNVERTLVKAGATYRVEWRVTDASGTYLTTQGSKRLAVGRLAG